MAKQETPRVGLEPTRGKLQTLENKGLTENQNPYLSTSLDKILQNYPQVKRIIAAWPALSEQDKKTIIEAVNTMAGNMPEPPKNSGTGNENDSGVPK